jgi:hypothetical protein
VPLREAHGLCNYYQSKNVHFFLEFLCVSLGGYLKDEISGYHTKITRHELFLAPAKVIPFFCSTWHNSTCLSLEKIKLKQKLLVLWPHRVATVFEFLDFFKILNCLF